LHYFCSNETAVSETAVSEMAIKKDKDMRFFDRTEEIASLRKIREMAKNNAQFTVVTGRRRIGKTSLVWKAYEDEPILYFFVARKAEGDLCEDYRLEIENKLGVPTMGRAEHFTDVFEYLMKLSAERPITLFIDEFQEFFRVNKSVFSDMQRIWDLYSPKSRINLIVCGSIYSMMTKIFKDKKEPLYNRQSRFMTVRPFTPTVLKDILSEYNPGCLTYNVNKNNKNRQYNRTGGLLLTNLFFWFIR
jgi:uncharacterized protein